MPHCAIQTSPVNLHKEPSVRKIQSSYGGLRFKKFVTVISQVTPISDANGVFELTSPSPMHYARCARMHIRRTGSGGKSDLKLPIYNTNDAPFHPFTRLHINNIARWRRRIIKFLWNVKLRFDYLARLPAYMYTMFSIDRPYKWRVRSVSHHIYFSDPKFMYDLPSRDPKIESFLIVERRTLSI